LIVKESNMAKISFKGICVIHMVHNPGDPMPNLTHSEINLELSKNLDASRYLTPRGVPNKDGAHCLTNVFIQGLVANIHHSHQNGYKDSAEHLRYIISELERGFVTNVDSTESTFDEP
jgi:hypothetical protein